MASGALHHPSFSELTRVSARIGFLSFGGPAGQIALMHRELVDERRWVTEDDYLQALNLCHLLPGPEAQQLATWIGWKHHGWRGGLVAGGLFVIPGALVMLALSMLYAFAANLDWFAALFLGIKAAVLAIIAQALLRIAGRAIKTPFQWVLAAAAFAALFLFDAPFPLVVLTALALGAIVGARRPDWLALKPVGPAGEAHPRPWGASLRAVLVWLAVWAAPMAAVLAFLGSDHVLWDIGVFFSQLAVVTFGGAYAVLAYMAQEAVSGYGWLSAGEMADGLGLAETTSGPLIMVTQFVSFLAGFRDASPLTPLAAGVAAAGLTTWVTFAPCFLWIFACAPWMDRLERSEPLQGALAAITAAVVGVIANLAVWFAWHVLFPGFDTSKPGFFEQLDWRAAFIGLAAAVLLFRFNRGVPLTLALCALAGLGLGLVKA
jgi:chromate transporter